MLAKVTSIEIVIFLKRRNPKEVVKIQSVNVVVTNLSKYFFYIWTVNWFATVTLNGFNKLSPFFLGRTSGTVTVKVENNPYVPFYTLIYP